LCVFRRVVAIINNTMTPCDLITSYITEYHMHLKAWYRRDANCKTKVAKVAYARVCRQYNRQWEHPSCLQHNSYDCLQIFKVYINWQWSAHFEIRITTLSDYSLIQLINLQLRAQAKSCWRFNNTLVRNALTVMHSLLFAFTCAFNTASSQHLLLKFYMCQHLLLHVLLHCFITTAR
jgi:hypothetical protein